MSGLVEFLLARIDEDEAVAKAAFVRNGEHGPGGLDWYSHHDSVIPHQKNGIGIATAPTGGSRIATHIAHWDPARVLRECEAKRAVVEQCRYVGVLDHKKDPIAGVMWAALDQAVQMLARAYREHPDYRAGWEHT